MQPVSLSNYADRLSEDSSDSDRWHNLISIPFAVPSDILKYAVDQKPFFHRFHGLNHSQNSLGSVHFDRPLNFDEPIQEMDGGSLIKHLTDLTCLWTELQESELLEDGVWEKKAVVALQLVDWSYAAITLAKQKINPELAAELEKVAEPLNNGGTIANDIASFFMNSRNSLSTFENLVPWREPYLVKNREGLVALKIDPVSKNQITLAFRDATSGAVQWSTIEDVEQQLIDMGHPSDWKTNAYAIDSRLGGFSLMQAISFAEKAQKLQGMAPF